MFSRLFPDKIILIIILLCIFVECQESAFKPVKGNAANAERLYNLRESPGRGSSSIGPTNTNPGSRTHSRVGSSDTLDLKDIPIAVSDSGTRDPPVPKMLISPTDMQNSRRSKSKFSSASSIASSLKPHRNRDLATPEPPSDKQQDHPSMETPIIDITRTRSRKFRKNPNQEGMQPSLASHQTVPILTTDGLHSISGQIIKTTDEMNHIMMMAPFAQKNKDKDKEKDKETHKLSSSPNSPPKFVGQSRILATPNDSDEDDENSRSRTEVIDFDGILKIPPSASSRPSKPGQDHFNNMPILALYQPATPQFRPQTQEYNIPIATDNSFNTAIGKSSMMSPHPAEEENL